MFSIRHALEDTDAAVAYVRRPDIAERFAIDTRRIVLGGHSMGGFASASHARTDQRLLGVFLIDAWNVGEAGEAFAKVTGPARAAMAGHYLDDIGNSLQGATSASIAEELVAHRAQWNFLSWAQDLTGCPLLIIGASRAGGEGEENRQLAEAVARDGGHVTALTLPSDHSFEDHRIALAAQVVDWLQKLPNP
jgi:pimeloyl-ACP methyl ester carboxylesterase